MLKKTAKDPKKITVAQSLKDSMLAKFGKGTVVPTKAEKNIPVVTTGSLALNGALGIGGLPRGRIVEVYGPESSSKTTMALHAIAADQKIGNTCAFIDVEHALDPTYCKALGIDYENLIHLQPNNAEEALQMVRELIPDCSIIVVDSVAALVPASELAGEAGDQKMGLVARLMGQHMRMVNGAASKSNTLLIYINQIRDKIGVVFGSPETTPGGKALRFYSTIRIRNSKTNTGAVKGGDGFQLEDLVTSKVVKNKMAPPMKVARYKVRYGLGIDLIGEILDLGVECGIVKKSGAWYSYDGVQVGQGKEGARLTIESNPELQDELYNKLIAKISEDNSDEIAD
jgi:recombination protein RecA